MNDNYNKNHPYSIGNYFGPNFRLRTQLNRGLSWSGVEVFCFMRVYTLNPCGNDKARLPGAGSTWGFEVLHTSGTRIAKLIPSIHSPLVEYLVGVT